MICSQNKLKEEFHPIKNVLSDHGCPKDVISKPIFNKISQLFKPKVFGPNKSNVYLRSPFVGLARVVNGPTRSDPNPK